MMAWLSCVVSADVARVGLDAQNILCIQDIRRVSPSYEIVHGASDVLIVRMIFDKCRIHGAVAYQSSVEGKSSVLAKLLW